MLERRESGPILPEIGKDFFVQAFNQAKEQPLREAKIQGIFLPRYAEIWSSHKKKLHDINPSLTVRSSLEKGFLDFDTKDIRKNIDLITRVNPVRSSYNKSVNELLTAEIIPELASQKIDPDILSTPPVYYHQEGGRTCYLAAFRMVFTGITGQRVEESTLLEAARETNLLIYNGTDRVQPVSNENNSYLDVEENNLLTVLQTPVFKQEFGNIEVGVARYTATDFTKIAETAKRIQTKAAQKDKVADSYFIAIHGSEDLTFGWHTSVLLSADEDTVTVHDPSKAKGGAYKEFPKEKFISLWAKTHLRGDHIFALKPADKQ